jgi:hypothetical protein
MIPEVFKKYVIAGHGVGNVGMGAVAIGGP